MIEWSQVSTIRAIVNLKKYISPQKLKFQNNLRKFLDKQKRF